jgi:hypothetical protein
VAGATTDDRNSSARHASMYCDIRWPRSVHVANAQ